MIDLPYSLVIEATEEPDYFGFYSTELEGFTGSGHSVEDCLSRVLDAWIFAARTSPVDCVWVSGRKWIEAGRHRARTHRRPLPAEHRPVAGGRVVEDNHVPYFEVGME